MVFYSLSNLIKYKTRSFLLMLSVLVCVFMIANVDGMLSQMRKGFSGELARYMGKIIIQQKGSGYPPFDSSIPEEIYIQTLTVEGINKIESSKMIAGVVEKARTPMEFAQVTLIGLEPGHEAAYLVDTKVDKGSLDISNNNVLLGAQAYEFYKKPEINSTIKVLDNKIKITGVLEKTGQDNLDRAIFVSYETAQRIYNKGNQATAIILTAEKAEEIDDLVKILEDKFPEYEIFTQKDIKKQIDNIMSMPNKFMGMISAMVFVVSVIIITNIMIISVKERRKEFGILRAIGFERWHIIRGVLIESFVLSLFGGGLGLFLAIPASSIMGWNYILSLTEIVKLMVLILIIGTISGLYPAYTASCVHPIEAIRNE